MAWSGPAYSTRRRPLDHGRREPRGHRLDGWRGPCNLDSFARGVATNYGGTWHQLTLPAEFPRRYISNVVIDPNDADGLTAYAVFNGFSRRWNEGPGAGIGHLWRTTDGGATWTDVSAGLPDVPANDVLLVGTRIVVATDLGVVVSSNGGTTWSRLGGNLPYTTTLDVHLGPDDRIYAATPHPTSQGDRDAVGKPRVAGEPAPRARDGSRPTTHEGRYSAAFVAAAASTPRATAACRAGDSTPS